MMATSQNGYPANRPEMTKTWLIPGTERTIRLHRGDPGYLLVDFAAWFDKSIESIDDGQLDDWGYAERPIRGESTVLSNHASGTAIDLNALKHVLGARGTFTPAQTKRIREKLEEYDGCIRWGGDYRNRPDEMHFEIDKPLAEVTRVARRIRKQKEDWLAMASKEDVKDALREVLREPLVRVAPSDRGAFSGDPDRVSILDALTRDWNLGKIDLRVDQQNLAIDREEEK